MFTFEEYISPISDTGFAGIEPRSDVSPTSTYYALKDLRNQLRASERVALVDEEGISSLSRDWLPLLEQCSEAIKTESKDIEYLAWLIESMCRLHGFRGLAFGFRIAHYLIDNHFEDLFPLLDKGDEKSDKVSALVGLNGIATEGALIIPIKSIPLTDGTNYDSFTFWEYQQAYEISRLSEEKREKKIAQGGVDFDEIEQSALETSSEFFLQLKADIENAIEEFAVLSDVMDRVTEQPQPTSNIKQALEFSLSAVNHVGGDKLQAVEQAGFIDEQLDDSENASDEIVDKQNTQSINNGVIDSRASAVKKLEEIAHFFRKTEPHSPMSYTIEQVIRWSELSLPELLNELITDNDARSGYFKLSGIKVSETET
ncbi:type VI secretion system protein TssA [Pseudoalteromonas mariniglutinosa]|uniref:type VI secretion system protein TssA n=1 Tax=Pseudoalteromonas mariniglutinosa TaxID=206042 RepID=UPI00384E60F0